MSLRALAFDWGHTIMDEVRDRDVPLDGRPIATPTYVIPSLVELPALLRRIRRRP